ncbi:hypothetical protein N7486_001266 [Penicillium sp. IBT 16267x]|nr:hypothetical protein N7486_001266 [Penicillium sp. IBT 16267x]
MPAYRSGSNRRDGRCETRSTNEGSALPSTAKPNGPQSAQPSASKPEIKLLPASYEVTETPILVMLISDMIMELIHINDKIPLHQNQLTRFHSRSPPGISVHSYLQRLVTYAHLSPPVLLSMVYYIDLLSEMYPAFTVTSLTIHRFLIVSATVASKGLSDAFWTNKTYARIGGISPAELALLELEFLFRVKWQVVPSPEMLDDYYHHLVERSEGFEIESHALQG